MILLRRGPESPTPNRDQSCLSMSRSSDSGPSLGNGWSFASARERSLRMEPVWFAAHLFGRSSRAASVLVGARFLAKRDECRRVLFGRNRFASRFLSDCYSILKGSCRVDVTKSICSCGNIWRAKHRVQYCRRPLHLIRVENDRKAQKRSQEGAPQKKWSALQLENFSRGCGSLTGDRHGFLERKIVTVWQLLGGPSIGDLEE